MRCVWDAARAMGVEVELLCDGWVLRLSEPKPGGRVRYVHGYAFDLNPAATHMVCCDKAATSAALRAAGVPCVHHELFLHGMMARFSDRAGDWDALRVFADGCGLDCVVKDNTGTGGRSVVRAKGWDAIRVAVEKVLERSSAAAVCRYVPLAEEVRVIVLDGVARVLFEKHRPVVVGDGVRSVRALAMVQLGAKRVAAIESEGVLSAAEWERVPEDAEHLMLNWRHNLGQGSMARIVDPSRWRGCEREALRAAAALGLRFGSVDVVIPDDEPGKRLPMVLEVNSGVMMEGLAKGSAEGMELAVGVYGEAVRKMFDSN